jgi:acetyltransferase-like isoleucine patch superfamily enzyme
MALFSRKRSGSSEDPLMLVNKAFRRLCNKIVNATFPFESLGVDLKVHYSTILEKSTAHRIRIGHYVRLRKGVRVEVLAPIESKDESKLEPVIVFGHGTDIGSFSTIRARNSIHLEQEVTLAQSVLLMDHSPAHEDLTLPIKDQGITEGGRIRIEQGCFIGQGTAIVCDKGELVLGRNCVVAANSLVTRSFPAHCLIAGNPARVIQQFDPVKNEWVLGGARKKESKPAD